MLNTASDLAILLRTWRSIFSQGSACEPTTHSLPTHHPLTTDLYSAAFMHPVSYGGAGTR